MNGVLRHFAVRLWCTALMGTAGCFLVLPFWQSILKLQWVMVPVALVMLICFLLLGFFMNQWGMARIQRLIHEAGIWERGGVSDTAREVYGRAIIVFDSFWLSPGARSRAEQAIIPRLARFYLSQPATMELADDLVKRHLIHHPEDTSLVKTWLEQIQTNPQPTTNDDLLAARIGAVLSDDEQVQTLLMQYYLSHRRHDFDALQTYRRVWELPNELPDTVLHALAHLLLKNRLLNDWALQVYLKAHLSGDPYSLEGIVVAEKNLQPHPGNQAILAQAETICHGVDADFRENAMLRFGETVPVVEPARVPPKQASGKSILVQAVELVRQAIRMLMRMLAVGSRRVLQVLSLVGRSAAKGRQLTVRLPGRRIFRFSITIALVLIMGVLVYAIGYRYQTGATLDEQPIVKTPEPDKEPHKPFTIQVAAYLNPEDARLYVSKLRRLGLDAFSTQAVSAQRKWYQVKVSSFETKLSAREYGQKLKSQGIIDDFYVANFQREIKSSPKTP